MAGRPRRARRARRAGRRGARARRPRRARRRGGPFVVPWSEAGGIAPLRLRRTVEAAVRSRDRPRPGLAARARPARAPGGAADADRRRAPLGARGRLGGDAVGQRRARARRRTREVSRARLQAFGRGGAALDQRARQRARRAGRAARVRRRPAPGAAALGGRADRRRCCCCRRWSARSTAWRACAAAASRSRSWLRWLARGRRAVPARGARRAAARAGRRACPALRGRRRPDGAAGSTRAGARRRRRSSLVLGFVAARAGRRGCSACRGARATPGDVPGGAAAAIALALDAARRRASGSSTRTPRCCSCPPSTCGCSRSCPRCGCRARCSLALVLAGLRAVRARRAVLRARSSALDPLELAWMALLLLAGGTSGPLGVLAWSARPGLRRSARCSSRSRKRRGARRATPSDRPVTTRGPLSYAGPGSLGGTESALRR